MDSEKLKKIGIGLGLFLILLVLVGEDLIGLAILVGIIYFFIKRNKESRERLNESAINGDAIIFSSSTLLFWIKGSVVVTDKAIITQVPNRVFFGLVPAGLSENKIPIRTISGVNVYSDFRIRDILIGLFLLMTIVLFPLGLLFLDSGMQYRLVFEKSGTYQVLNVPFFDKEALYVIQDQIEEKMDKYEDRSDLSIYFDKKEEKQTVPQTAKLSEQLSELKDLLEQGYLSEEEFDFKRKKLLDL